MTRASFERKLLEDEEFRKTLEQLAYLARSFDEAQKMLDEQRGNLHHAIYALVRQGAPKASLARQVGLSPQRINSIVREQQAKHRQKGKRS